MSVGSNPAIPTKGGKVAKKKNNGEENEEETRRKFHKALDEGTPDSLIEGGLGIIQDKIKKKKENGDEET